MVKGPPCTVHINSIALMIMDVVLWNAQFLGVSGNVMFWYNHEHCYLFNCDDNLCFFFIGVRFVVPPVISPILFRIVRDLEIQFQSL